VERALEKLRGTLTKRGISTATALATVISTKAVQVAPAGLATTLTAASIAGVGTGTFTLLKIMNATKIKLAFSALIVASATTALVVQLQTKTGKAAVGKRIVAATDHETAKRQRSFFKSSRQHWRRQKIVGRPIQ
jgi:hypothetical protein